VIIPPDGIVNLKDKQYPICELYSLDQHHHFDQQKDDYHHHQYQHQQQQQNPTGTTKVTTTSVTDTKSAIDHSDTNDYNNRINTKIINNLQSSSADYNSGIIDNENKINNNHVIGDKCNELQHDYNYDPHYVYTRGHVDVTNFKKYLQSLPNSIWNDDNQDGKLSYPTFIYVL
jgi:hypothetical protein